MVRTTIIKVSTVVLDILKAFMALPFELQSILKYSLGITFII